MALLPAEGAPGSYHHPAKRIKNSITRAAQTIVEPFDKRKPTAMALKAGEFSLHHELAVHRSAPNHAAHRRVGIGLNYLPPHVRVNTPVRLKPMLLPAEDPPGTFDLLYPPHPNPPPAPL